MADVKRGCCEMMANIVTAEALLYTDFPPRASVFIMLKKDHLLNPTTERNDYIMSSILLV
jgi:hypothetical protein